MAGDVTASIMGGTLHITGDSANNNIEIYQQADNSIRIQSTEPFIYPAPANYYTKINGSTSTVINGSFSNINVSMNGGNDNVRFHDADVPWDLEINLGTGTDWLKLEDVSTGDDLTVRTQGSGSSYISRDYVEIYDVEVGGWMGNNDLAIHGSTGIEEVRLRNVTVYDDMGVYLTKGSENDYLRIYAGVDLVGDSFGGNAALESDYTYVYDMDVDNNLTISRAQTMYVYYSDIGGNFYADGTSQNDYLLSYYNNVGSTFDIDAFAGDDRVYVYGSSAVDINGYSGNDTLYGGNGDDRIFRGNGNDLIVGRGGNDTLNGQRNNDVIKGDAGDDVLYGEHGNDELWGGTGNDYLGGGSGTDKLRGEAGMDGLWGSGSDDLDGGADADRYYNLNGSANSAIGSLAGSNDIQIGLGDGQAIGGFAAGKWSQSDVTLMDQAFQMLTNRVGGNGPLWGMPTLWRGTTFSGNAGGVTNAAAINGMTFIAYGNGTFNGSDQFAMSTVIHETAHNWDTPDEMLAVGLSPQLWSDFYNISWTISPPPTGFTNAYDTRDPIDFWNNSSAFAPGTYNPPGPVTSDNYGKHNPFEDWATMWEYYFFNTTPGTSGPVANNSALQSKVDAIDAFFDAF